MPDPKETAPRQTKYFELGKGEDCLGLIIPFENLKTFHRLISLFLEKDQTKEKPDVTGYYVTHRGTFKSHHI